MIKLVRDSERIEIVEISDYYMLLFRGQVLTTFNSPKLMMFLNKKQDEGWEIIS